jgi:hypothetical protein
MEAMEAMEASKEMRNYSIESLLAAALLKSPRETDFLFCVFHILWEKSNFYTVVSQNTNKAGLSILKYLYATEFHGFNCRLLA